MDDLIFATALYAGLALAVLAESVWRVSMGVAFVLSILFMGFGTEISKTLIRNVALTIVGYVAYTTVFGGARYMQDYRDVAILYISAAVYIAFSLPILRATMGIVRG